MTIEITKLKNGLRIVTQRMPHVETASLGVWVQTGSRYESEQQQGISHFLEHMAFKGTAKRSARQIAEALEEVGGDLNAATGLEMTSYYARVLKEDVALALEVLADILLNPLLDEGEIEREREVILQEIASTRDSPEETVLDLAQAAAFPDQPVGRPILGTPRSVKAFTAGEMRAFLKRWYGADRMVISVAGNIRHDRIVRLAEALFSSLHPVKGGAAQGARYVGGLKATQRPFEQSHLYLGLEGPSFHHPSHYANQIFSNLLGGGMSSRLFQEVRERRGLCYSIYSSAWALEDIGLFSVQTAAGQANMTELIDVVCGEIKRASEEPITAAEIERSKAQLKAGLMMGLESPSGRAEQMARQVLLFDRVIPVAETIGRIEAVTPKAVEGAARALLKSKPVVVLAGAGPSSRGHLRRVERLLEAA